MINILLVVIIHIHFNNTDVYKINYNNKACECGEIRVYNSKTGSLSYTFPKENDGKKIPPYSYIKWRPNSNTYKTKNVFVTTNADGEI